MSLAWSDNSRNFEYADLYREQRGTFFSKDRYVVVSMYETLWSLVYVSTLYIMCAWYFDQTLQANRGVPLPWYFPMDPAYWFSFMGLGSSNSQVADTSPLKVVKSSSADARNTAANEKNTILEDELKIADGTKKAHFDGVRAIGLSKSYASILGAKAT